MSQDILVVAEHVSGELTDITFELLGKARELASVAGSGVTALLLGSGISGSADMLGAADKVISVDHANLKDFNPDAYVACVTEVLRDKAPRLTLVANTSMGMDLAAALSVRLDWPLLAYATNVAFEGDSVTATSQLYGGKVYAESVIDAPHGIVSVLAGSFAAEEGKKEGSPEVENVAPPAAVESPRVRFLELIAPEAGDVDITQQDVLVCVGRGIQSNDNIELAEKLASALGGAVCASRPIVDAKWLPKVRQVGKSGLKVKPKIYITLGVSGAPEHIEGMKDAELIVAVNTDETAPIFEHAHYGTTEDLFDIVPALTEKLS